MDTTNEPVAWMERKINLLTGESIYSFKKAQPEIGDIPLYTHPHSEESVKVKELTDEEIIAVGNAVVNHIDSNEGWIEFARAILRKAQEK